MTPSEILLKFKTNGSADFLNALDEDDLWGFLGAQDDAFWYYGPSDIYLKDELYLLVVAELRREVAADLKVKQEWIDELEIHWVNQEPIGDRVTREIIEYLKERQVK